MGMSKKLATLLIASVVFLVILYIPEEWYIRQIILAWYLYIPIGIYLALFLIGIPAAYVLQNKPYKIVDGKVVKSNFAFFTALLPGQAKIVQLGDDFEDLLLNFPGHTIAGEKTDASGMKVNNISKEKEPEKYYEVVESGDGPDFQLIPFPKPQTIDLLVITYRYPWWLWKSFVYKFTKLLFTGIWPLQTVFTYEMRYWNEEGVFVQNRSDHFRVQPFDFNVLIPSAGTKDSAPIRIETTFTAQVFNPYLAAYKTDYGNWSRRVNSFLPSEVDNYTRGKPLSDVYASEDTGVINTILSLGAIVPGCSKEDEEPFFHTFGIKMLKAGTPDRSIVDEKLERQLLQPAIALAAKKANITTAEGQARAIKIITKAIKKGEGVGELVAQLERDKIVTRDLGEGANLLLSLGNSGNNDTEILKSLLAKISELTPEK